MPNIIFFSKIKSYDFLMKLLKIECQGPGVNIGSDYGTAWCYYTASVGMSQYLRCHKASQGNSDLNPDARVQVSVDIWSRFSTLNVNTPYTHCVNICLTLVLVTKASKPSGGWL